MSGSKRLPEEDYAATIDAIEEQFHKTWVPEIRGDRSATFLKSMTRVKTELMHWTDEIKDLTANELRERLDKAGGALLIPEEIVEVLCKELVERAENGDKQADTDLRALMISVLNGLIQGYKDHVVTPPNALLQYIRDELMRSLPYDKDQLRFRQLEITMAVQLVLDRLPSINATRNEANRGPEHPESACSLVAQALTKFGRAMSENNVQKAWNEFKHLRK